MTKRRWPRAKTTIKVVAPLDTRLGIYHTRDIGRGGMFLLMEKPWREGSMHEVFLHHGASTVSTRVRVIRATPDGVAVEFSGANPEIEAAVKSFLSDIFGPGVPIDEQRQAPRLPAVAPVAWRRGRREARGQLIDVSLNGAGIASRSPPPLGVTVLVQLPEIGSASSPHEISAAFGCEARVMRHIPDGFAVRFLAMSDEFRGAVARLRQASRHTAAGAK